MPRDILAGLPLFQPPETEPEARYREWLETDTGQQVFKLFERFTLELLRQGRRFGFRLIAERVRWEVRTTWPVTDWKLNNNLVPQIGRELVSRHPEVADLVEFRERREP